MRKAMLLLAVLGLAWTLWAAEPFAGTWKENVAKSHTSTPNKNQVVEFTAQENGLKLAADGIDADGKTFHVTYAAKFDGSDYPLTGFTGADTIAIKRIDANTFSELIKKAGEEVVSARLVVSKDGKTLTRTTKEKNAKGQNVSSTYVLEKQ